MSDQPFISVVIPTHERPGQLRACLDSLASVKYPTDRFEVIVVDDGSAVRPDAALERASHKVQVSLLCQSRAGPAAARNAGAHQARGQILAFLDDDCIAAPDWLQALDARLDVLPDAAVGGRTVNALPESLCSTASQMLFDYLHGCFESASGRGGFLTSNNLALSRTAFEAVGGFDSRFARPAAEDRDLCDRWLGDGRQLVYAPEAVVYHAHVMGLHGFWAQHFTYGRGAYLFHRLRAERKRPGVSIAKAAFYLRLLQYSMTRAGLRRAPALTVLLCLTRAATAAGYFWEALAARRSAVP